MKEAGALLGSVPCKGASHVMLMKPAAPLDTRCVTLPQSPAQQTHLDTAPRGARGQGYLGQQRLSPSELMVSPVPTERFARTPFDVRRKEYNAISQT